MLAIIPLVAFAQDPPVIIGETQNMRFTDVTPDFKLDCTWTSGYGCYSHIDLDVNGDGQRDISFSYNHTECNMSSLVMIQWYRTGNVEFVNDSVGVTRYNKGDTLGPLLKQTLRKDYASYYDSVGVVFFDTTFIPVTPYWVDTSAQGSLIALYGCMGGYDVDWIFTSDTNYFAFRTIENSDTAYGWVKTHSSEDGYLFIESVAVSGDTGNFVFTGTEKIPDIAPGLKLYPNPTKEQITIESPFQKYRCEILLADGRKLWGVNAEEKKKSIDISQLKTGLYFIRISSDVGMITERFIKE